MASPSIRQPLEQEDRKEDESQTGKRNKSLGGLRSAQVTEPDDRRFEQRQVIHHIIEQIVELILYIKQGQPNIP